MRATIRGHRGNRRNHSDERDARALQNTTSLRTGDEFPNPPARSMPKNLVTEVTAVTGTTGKVEGSRRFTMMISSRQAFVKPARWSGAGQARGEPVSHRVSVRPSATPVLCGPACLCGAHHRGRGALVRRRALSPTAEGCRRRTSRTVSTRPSTGRRARSGGFTKRATSSERSKG